MNPQFERYLGERKIWQDSFDHLLKFSSEGVLQNEILSAKEIFYAKLGRAHEMKEDLYDTASQSFLEWYLFEYPTKLFLKTPAVTFLTLGASNAAEQDSLDRSLFDRWSLFEVVRIDSNQILLEDLLFKKTRKLVYDPEAPECRLWKVKVGQVIQTRLFPLSFDGFHFFTHMWLHPKAEDELLKKLCDVCAEVWGEHKDLLLSAFEAVVRTYGLQHQIAASRAHNWLYEELWNRYAKTQ